MGKSENREARKLWERIQRHQKSIDKLRGANIPRALGPSLIKTATKLRDEQVERSEKLIEAYVEKLKGLMENGANPFR